MYALVGRAGMLESPAWLSPDETWFEMAVMMIEWEFGKEISRVDQNNEYEGKQD